MTRFDPSILVNRLNVFKNGIKVVDLSFRSGFNVVYGENSSGKSSVLEFLFYGLGGESPKWQPAAQSCTEVVLEAQFNGEVITLRRPISDNPRQMTSMDIYWGRLDEALSKANALWQRFPYRRAEKRESFTQVLFEALGMPAVPTREGANVTMHQILRLVYSDQMTSPEEIFRQDSFDKHLTKEMVGEIICGVYDTRLYEIELEKVEKEKHLADVTGQLRMMFSALGYVKDDLGLAAIKRNLEEIEAEKDGLLEKIDGLRQGDLDTAELTSEQKKESERLRKLLLSLDQQAKELEERNTFLSLDIEDSSSFIHSLKENLEALRNSEITAAAFGAIKFDACPACLTPLKKKTSPDACGVCGQVPPKGEAGSQRLRLSRDLEMQINESSEIHDQRVRELKSNSEELRRIRAKIKSERRSYEALTSSVVSTAQREIQRIFERVGYLERQHENLAERMELGAKIDELSEQKAALNSELSKLGDEMKSIEHRREKRKARAYTAISEKCREFLNDDLERQAKFKNARHVGFNFAKDGMSVDGVNRFSASSMVFLKNAFLTSILLASTEDAEFCFPRLLFLDGIEDKGMEVPRVHHLQKLIEERSRNTQVSHQVIITAEKLASDFVDSEYVVGGQRYTHENKTIQFSGIS